MVSQSSVCDASMVKTKYHGFKERGAGAEYQRSHSANVQQANNYNNANAANLQQPKLLTGVSLPMSDSFYSKHWEVKGLLTKFGYIPKIEKKTEVIMPSPSKLKKIKYNQYILV